MIWTADLQKQLRECIWRIDLCGCGSGGSWVIMKQILERAEDHEKLGSFYDPMEGASSGWVEFAAEVCDGWDLLEHGTGIGYAWLTESGKLLLEFLREFGVDDKNWPEWAESEVVH